jgi:hypothetical protein
MRRTGGATVSDPGLRHNSTGRRLTNTSGAVAPPKVVQAAAFNYAASPQTVAFGSPVTSGSLLIAAVGNDAFGVASVTDSQGNIWAPAVVEDPGSFFSVSLHWAKAGSTAADSVTVHTTNAALSVAQVYEVTGIASPTPVDATGAAANLSPAPITGPNLSGLAGTTDLVIYWAFYGTQGNVAVGGIWTSDYTALVGGGHFVGAAYAVTGPAVTGPTIDPGNTVANVIVGAAFHP